MPFVVYEIFAACFSLTRDNVMPDCISVGRTQQLPQEILDPCRAYNSIGCGNGTNGLCLLTIPRQVDVSSLNHTN
ncbi:hypothetical protein MKW98_009931 [Papaver atlanticum]|uniref:Uncharacterized protein n=1 Tax=Papaver atlanticum TaxID=357466 RepID=A0AAD4XQZ8_9MAGN|nr:hypothetical protein MKW98_009931 [Papaver atlanticum]